MNKSVISRGRSDLISSNYRDNALNALASAVFAAISIIGATPLSNAYAASNWSDSGFQELIANNSIEINGEYSKVFYSNYGADPFDNSQNWIWAVGNTQDLVVNINKTISANKTNGKFLDRAAADLYIAGP